MSEAVKKQIHALIDRETKNVTSHLESEQFSVFIEYKYLDCTSTQIDTDQKHDLSQHLVGAGVRFFSTNDK